MKSFKETIKEDVKPGYAPEEITFMGYTTKNLHHSADAAKAFQSTIEKVKRGEILDREGVLHALKATDTYMKLNDMHLEQGKAPDEKEINQWKQAHAEARNHLHKIGEFMHHMDYWHMHEHELQDMETKYTPSTAGAEMADSYIPQGDQINESATRFIQKVNAASKAYRAGRHDNAKMHLDNARSFMLGVKSTDMRKIKDAYDTYKDLRKKYAVADSDQQIKEELTDKTIRLSDKVKVARVIADMLGVEKVESMSPDQAVNQAFRKVKSKRMTPEFVAVLKKMVTLAGDVGIKIDASVISKQVNEQATEVNKNTEYNLAKGILKFKDYAELTKVNKGIVPVGTGMSQPKGVEPALAPAEMDVVDTQPQTQVGHSLHDPAEDQLRRMKVAYKTEEVNAEEVDEVETADYKTDKRGRKHRAHEIVFGDGDKQNDVKEEVDFSDDELEKMAAELEDEEDVLDAYDPDELMIVDTETGEEVEDEEEEMNEEALNEVLSRLERMKAKIRFLRSKAKRERRMQIALKRRSDVKTLTKRARRLAVKTLKERIAKKSISKMSVAEKERIEKMLQSRKALIDRLAMRMLPRVKKIENDRLSHSKKSQPTPAAST
jgi:hypothetical protein